MDSSRSLPYFSGPRSHIFLLLTGPQLTLELWSEMNEPPKGPVLAWRVTDREADAGSLYLRNSLLFIYYFTCLCVTQNLMLPHKSHHTSPNKSQLSYWVPLPKCAHAPARLPLSFPKCSWNIPHPRLALWASSRLNADSVYYSRGAIFKGVEILVKIKVKNVNHSQARSPYASKASCFSRHHPPASLLQVSISSGEK